MKRRLLMTLLAVLVAAPTFAQTILTQTTTAAAVTAGEDTVTLASATGVAVDDVLYVDGEAMRVTTVPTTGAQVGVRRGSEGTAAVPHASGARVWHGEGRYFSTDTLALAGTPCTASAELALPRISVRTGAVHDCEGGVWLSQRSLWAAEPHWRDYTIRDSFDSGYLIMQDDGTAKSVTDDEDNFVYGSPLGAIEYREELSKTASSWIVADGLLDVSADDGATDAEGVEIAFGTGEGTDMGWIVAGTQGGCFAASLTIANISASDFVEIALRQNEAFVDNGTVVSYTVWNAIGIHNSEDGSIISAQEVSEATDTDDSAVNWADGETRALKLCVSKAGVPTAFYSDAYTHSQLLHDQPTWNAVPMTETGSTLTAGTQLVPAFILLHGDEGADSDIRVNWVELTRLP